MLTEQETKRIDRQKTNSDKIITNLTNLIYYNELEQNNKVIEYYIRKMDYFRESAYYV